MTSATREAPAAHTTPATRMTSSTRMTPTTRVMRKAAATRPRGDARTALRAVTLAAAAIAASVLPSALVRPETRRGPDVAIVLDVSMSMLAADVAPDRLTAARREITTLLRAAPPGRAAVIAFGGDARVICPLTSDIGAAIDAVTAATPGSAAPGGSEVALALARSGEVLKGSGTNGRVIILTDGEAGPPDPTRHAPGDTSSDAPDDAAAAEAHARELAARGHALTAIGVGTTKGAPVPVRDGQRGDFVQDDDGPRVSRLDEGRLRRLTERAGGRYMRLEPGRPASLEGLTLGAGRATAARDAAAHGAALPDAPLPDGGVPGAAVTHDLWMRTGLLVLVAIGALLIDTALWWLRRSTTPWY
jgi:Ca-activated chloride channel family protein